MSGMRIGGLASGMDTDTMVKQLMDAEKVRLNKYNQQKQTKLWTQEAYNDVNKDFANFIVDTKKDLDIGITGNVNGASWLKNASSSDEDIFKVSTRAGAVPGNHKIRVKQLAKGVNIASKSDVANDKLGVDGSIEFEIDVKGTPKTITVKYTADDSYETLATKINSAVNGDGDSLGLKASYDSGAQRFFLSTEKTGEQAQINIVSDSGNIINDKLKLNMEDNLAIANGDSLETTTTFESTKTMGDLMPEYDWDSKGTYEITIGTNTVTLSKTDTLKELQSKMDAIDGFTVTYDDTKSGGDTFKIAATKPIDLQVTDEYGLLESKLGLSGFTKSIKGQDAIIDFDGAEDITYSSNQFTINGISIDLKSDPKDDIKEYNISVDTDVDAVYDKIKGFVDKYNELIDKLNKKTSEKVYRDYKPLTAKEKTAMNDKDTVKLWETKAKSGLLRNDEHITKILNSTRSGLYESVYTDYTKDGNDDNDKKLVGYSHISEIGITTGKYQDKGKLKIDENKLKEAIQNDVDGVMDLFFSKSDITETTINSETSADKKNELRAQQRAETGLITRLFDDITDGMKGIIDKSGTGENSDLYRKVKSNILIDFVTKSGSKSLLDKDLISIEKQIISENSRLAKKETAYYKKYAAMEKAMNKMNSQSSWLASQLK